MDKIKDLAGESLGILREGKPLVHNITNYVASNFQANVLLAVGASPVMAHSKDEVEDMVLIADALVLNMGTPSESLLESMILAGKKANELSKPVIFDPVGLGATPFRNNFFKRLFEEVKFDVIRGNASEIMALCGIAGKTKGVDSTVRPEEVRDMAKDFARSNKLVVASSGPVDYIFNDNKVYKVKNGVPMLGMITGSGCAVTSLIGAFSAVVEDKGLATLFALGLFGVAGERALKNSVGPGSFMAKLLDELYLIKPEEFALNLNFEIEEV